MVCNSEPCWFLQSFGFFRSTETKKKEVKIVISPYWVGSLVGASSLRRLALLSHVR